MDNAHCTFIKQKEEIYNFKYYNTDCDLPFGITCKSFQLYCNKTSAAS